MKVNKVLLTVLWIIVFSLFVFSDQVNAKPLTKKMGTHIFKGHTETWYNLKMDRVIERADAYYDSDEDSYLIRDDGVKTYKGFVICAADWSVHPYGSFVETSRGIGIVLDHHTVKGNKTLVDIATNW